MFRRRRAKPMHEQFDRLLLGAIHAEGPDGAAHFDLLLAAIAADVEWPDDRNVVVAEWMVGALRRDLMTWDSDGPRKPMTLTPAGRARIEGMIEAERERWRARHARRHG